MPVRILLAAALLIGCHGGGQSAIRAQESTVSGPVGAASGPVENVAPDAIYISDMAGTVEPWLAARLQHYLARMTGATVPIHAARKLPPYHGANGLG